jgi:hypothetical protein
VEYRSLSSLWRLLHSPVTSSLLGPNILHVLMGEVLSYNIEQHNAPLWSLT